MTRGPGHSAMKSCYQGYDGCRLKGLPIGIPFKSQFFIPKSKRSSIPNVEDLFIILRLKSINDDVSKALLKSDVRNQLDEDDSAADTSEAVILDTKSKAGSSTKEIDFQDSKDSFGEKKGVVKTLLSRHLEEEKLHSETLNTLENDTDGNEVNSLQNVMVKLFDADISSILGNLKGMTCHENDECNPNENEKVINSSGRKRTRNSQKLSQISAKVIKIDEDGLKTGKRKSQRIRSSGYRPDYGAIERGGEDGLQNVVLESEMCNDELCDKEMETSPVIEQLEENEEFYDKLSIDNGDGEYAESVEYVEVPHEKVNSFEEEIIHSKTNKQGKHKKSRKRTVREEDSSFDPDEDGNNEDMNINSDVNDKSSNNCKEENEERVLSESDDDKKQKVKKRKRKKSTKSKEGVESDPELAGLSVKEKTRVKQQRKKIEKESKRIKIRLQDHPDKYRIDVMESFARKDRGKSRQECATEVLVCTVCEKFKAKSTDAMETHIEGHVNGELHCVQCSYIAPFVNDLARHKREVHKRNVNICFECGVETNGLDGLRDHLGKVHGKPQYKCKFCVKEKNEQFAAMTKNHYRQHIRQVHPDKMAACKTCSRLFANETMLKKHIDLGCAGNRPSYACEKCGKTYSSQDRVNDHVERVHNKVRRFQCPHCPFTAARGAGLNQHLHIHTGFHPFKCEQCTFTCVQKYQLTSHMRTHTGVKPYKCSQCNYAAAWNVQLKEHVKVHTMVHTIVCEMCNIYFKDMRTFKTHQSKEHPIETHQATVRQPMETQQVTIRQPMEMQQVTIRQPMEIQQSTIRQPMDLLPVTIRQPMESLDAKQPVEVQQIRQPMETIHVGQAMETFQMRPPTFLNI